MALQRLQGCLPSKVRETASATGPWFRLSASMTVQATVSAAACGTSGPTHPGFATIGTRYPDPTADPTIQRNLRLGGTICPGTKLTFTPYHPAENFRLELDIPSISLDQYVQP